MATKRRKLLDRVRAAGPSGIRRTSCRRCLVCGELMEFVLSISPGQKKPECTYDHHCDPEKLKHRDAVMATDREPRVGGRTFDDRLADAELMMNEDDC